MQVRAIVVLALWLGAIVLAFAQQGDQCPDCGDPARPWMRGTTEISCAHPGIIAALREAHPGVRIDECGHCQHQCDVDGEHEESKQTSGRYPWDYRCAARCKAVDGTPGCACPSPCGDQ